MEDVLQETRNAASLRSKSVALVVFPAVAIYGHERAGNLEPRVIMKGQVYLEDN